MVLSRLFFGIHHPEIYHGDGSQQHFEGWYFKIVDVQQSVCWAIIPGIYKCIQMPELCQAFIMTLDGRTHKSTFHSFPVDDFKSDEKTFNITIGENRFSCQSISLDLPEIKGTIRFENLRGWPVTWVCPGIMGWYAYFPMECYHGLLSMDHTIRGSLSTPKDGGTIDFEGGRGYIEKDWGTNFPKCWIWIQANHFSDSNGTSISVSIARIPFYKLVFPGFIIGFLYENNLHQFTTHGGAKLFSVKVDDDSVAVETSNRTNRLKVTAMRAPTAILLMPTKDSGMVPKVDESVGSIVTVQFFKNDDLIFEGTSHHGGLEVFGEYEMLLR